MDAGLSGSELNRERAVQGKSGNGEGDEQKESTDGLKKKERAQEGACS